MNYYINPAALKSVMPLPQDAVMKNLKLASACQLKVLLYCFSDTAREISAENIANALGVDVYEVRDALLFWEQNGVLLNAEGSKIDDKPQKSEGELRPEVLPSREDVARRGNEDEKIRLLLREAQLKFGRNLKSNESRILVWLYDDKGMDVSVLLLLLHYAANTDRLRIGFIEKTALAWLDKGVTTLIDAEEQIAAAAREELCWKTVRSAFMIDRALPGKREQEYAALWVGEWGLSIDILREAYRICADSTGKLSFPYIAKILKAWHTDGIKTLDDLKKIEEHKSNDTPLTDGYDLAAFEDMLNKD